jgi:hypothetical protein
MDLDVVKRQFCDELLPLSLISNVHGVCRRTITSIVKRNKWRRSGSVYSRVVRPTKEQLREDYIGLSLRQLRTKYKTRDTILAKWLLDYAIPKKPKYLRRRYQCITDFQKQCILGSLLGDASVVKKGPQHRLSISHGHVQFDYIKHKESVLGDLALRNIQNTISKEHLIHGHVIKESHCHVLQTHIHPYFTELRNLIYPHGSKVVSQLWLEQLTPVSLAYWFMDDGSADYSNSSYSISIATYSYSHYEHLLLQSFMQSRFNITATVASRGLRFGVANARKFRDLVIEHIPDCMMYKISRSVWLKHEYLNSFRKGFGSSDALV